MDKGARKELQYKMFTYSAMSLRILCLVHFQILHLLFLTNLAFCSSTSLALAGNETDRLALLAFKSMILEDPHGALNSWNGSSHYCRWAGVTCNYRHKRVSVLDLRSRGLVGSLSPHIGNLSFLREIWLGNNTLEGRIPSEVGRLFRLQVLALWDNSIEGEIPANISHCSSLTFLVLAGNKLVGEIPKELGSLSKLTDLWLHFNNLTKIPPSIGNLTSLQTFSLLHNLIIETLPDAIGQLKNLRELTLGDNHFSGVIPPSVYNLSLITLFSLPYNRLSGSLPPNLGLMLPHLQNFQLGGNDLTGTLPHSLSNATQLEKIDIPYNHFSGKISINFAKLQNLWGVVLGANNLGSGEPDELSFIRSLSNCSDLHVIELQENQLKGELPNDVNFSAKLFYFSLMRNRIHGDIPSWIYNLFNLTQLLLSENEFSGSILANIGNLNRLQRFALDNNKLSGELPTSIGNLSFLNEIYLSNNLLQGNIPPSLGYCKNLSVMDLSQNNLSGTIPTQIFGLSTLSVSLNLSSNRLFGTLPSEVGTLRNLVALDVSENELSAEIPDTIGRCTSLEMLYLEGNFFLGAIPPSLSSMKGLRIVDFSSNNLSGQIPEFLETLSLTYLNLSYNDFEGRVPTKGAFANASAVSVAGNNRVCGGITELKLPTCTMNLRRRKKSYSHLILGITTASLLFSIIVVSALLYCWLKRKQNVKSSESLLKQPFSNLSYGDLLKATDGFSPNNLIGAGSFSYIYKGVLFDQKERAVAIKVLNLERRGASQSFMAECEALRNIRHRNFLKIITACSSIDFQGNDFKALVYEFMPNGSLDRWLNSRHETDEGQEHQPLNLHQRLNIAIDVACALDYMHNHCESPLIHCDLKPSNILLDGEMVAHVGDFGLAKFLPRLSDQNDNSSTEIRGTIGYAAPEYGLGSAVSEKGDVYSYGILVLEMLTGKRPTDPMFEEGLNLHNFVEMSMPDNVTDVLDPLILNNSEEQADISASGNQSRLENDYNSMEIVELRVPSNDQERVTRAASSNNRSINGNKRKDSLISMLKIGVACSMDSPEDRMDTSSVLFQINSIRGILQRD